VYYINYPVDRTFFFWNKEPIHAMYADFFYTIPQQVVLVVVSLISGLFSLIGSALILLIIWRDDHEKLKFVYHRILFAVSIVDCITSLNFAFSFLAVPKGIFWGALGNKASCEVAGFLTLLLGSQHFYNFGLALYFLLIICYGKSQHFIASHIEPFIHMLSLCFPIGIAVWSLLTDSLNPLLFDGGWCYVYSYPPGCSALDIGECTRGLTAVIILPALLIILGVIPFLGISICMIMIVYRVRKTFAATSSRRMHQRADERTKQIAIQSILYIAATLIPFTLIVITQNITSYDRTTRFILGILVKFFIPLQGVFNFFIYIRPRIISKREKDSNSSSFHILVWQIVFGEKCPGSPIEDSDFAPELTRLPVNSQTDLNGRSLESTTPG
jgi:hypothetical protein